MIEAVSCGGVVIYKWKILLLYKNQNGRYMGWVLPKGTVEEGETYRQTASIIVFPPAYSVFALVIVYPVFYPFSRYFQKILSLR